MSETHRIRTPHAELTLEDIAGVLPGTGEIMAGVGDAWWRCAYAARGGNWPLAAHFTARVRTLQRSLMVLRPKYREQLAEFERTEIAAVISAIKRRDRATFDLAFTAATDRANQLHVETSHAYVRWVLPDEAPKGLELGDARPVDGGADHRSVQGAHGGPTEDRPYHDRAWLAEHLRAERHSADLLGEIREALFGMQDGLVSTLAVVSTVSGATNDRFSILVAGIATALAGVFSMAAGEYLGSKSQREIFDAQIERERDEVSHRPREAEAEVAYMLEEEGLSPDAARHVASEFAREPNVLLRTMVEKELGIAVEEGRGAIQGAVVMGASFGIAATVPIVPYLFLEIDQAVPAAVVISAAVLFAIGVVKSRWTRRNPVVSGLQVVVLATFAGVVGYIFGSQLPDLLGVTPPVV